MGLNIVTPREQTAKCQDLSCKPVCLGSVSASRGGGGGGGKSVSLSSVPSAADVASPSAVVPPAAEDLLVATVLSSDDGAASDVLEGTGGSGLGARPSGRLAGTAHWSYGAGGGQSGSSPLSSNSKASPSSSSAKGTSPANTGNRFQRDRGLDFISDSENISLKILDS